MVKTTKHKKPWVAAILNFIIPGAGYLYLGKRKNFSLLLIASFVVFGVAIFNDPNFYEAYGNSNIAGLSAFIGGFAFALDAYNEAK